MRTSARVVRIFYHRDKESVIFEVLPAKCVLASAARGSARAPKLFLELSFLKKLAVFFFVCLVILNELKNGDF